MTDAANLTDTKTSTAVIANIAPAIARFAGATLLQGETYTATGSFADADPDIWTATVNYGDGSGVQTLALSGKSFALRHQYRVAGSHTVRVVVSDDDNGSGAQQATVTVQTPQQGITTLSATLNTLGLPAGTITALNAPLNAAENAVDDGNRTAATQQMEAFINQVYAQVRSRQISPANGQMLTNEANRIIRSINS